MKRKLDHIDNATYDLIVVGGGINGAAIAHMAALNGLDVLLLEKDDFANGTSSKSTKLVHGGLRYLENFEFGLVKESLAERFVQWKSSPHLVHALPTIIPVYKGDRRPLWMMKLGVTLYDLLSGKHIIEKHQALSVDEVVAHVPGIESTNLLGGVMYYDAQMNDARLCLENVLSAHERGADVANYVEVKSILKENGRTVGVKAFDKIGEKTLTIKCKRLVCAAGPWINEFMAKEQKQFSQKIRTTKGVHVVYRRKVSDKALFVPMRKDKRIFFIIPWYGNSLIGTTDTDYQGDLNRIEVEPEDIEYLLNEARRLFPNKEFNENNIITTFAGLRPLVARPGSPSEISRKHVLEESYTGIIYVMGGKYTTYRKIAEDVMRLVLDKELVDTTQNFPVFGSGFFEYDAQSEAQKYGVDESVVKQLIDFYGRKFANVLKLIQKDASLQEPLADGCDLLRAQVVYAKEAEFAQTPEDVIQRRLPLVYMDVDPKLYASYIDTVFQHSIKR